MGPEKANFRAIIGLLLPTVFLAKMSILNTVQWDFKMLLFVFLEYILTSNSLYLEIQLSRTPCVVTLLNPGSLEVPSLPSGCLPVLDFVLLWFLVGWCQEQ